MEKLYLNQIDVFFLHVQVFLKNLDNILFG